MINIQPGQGGRRKTPRKTSGGEGFAAMGNLLARVFQTALVIVVLGTFFHCYISLDQDIDRITGEIKKIQSDITSVEREIISLNGKYAHRTTRGYIFNQLRKFRLPLVMARHNQKRNLNVFSIEQAARISYPLRISRKVAQDNNRRAFTAGN